MAGQDADHGPGPGQVEAYRPWFRQHVRPASYSPFVHVLQHIGPPVLAAGYAVTRLHAVSVVESLIVPAMLVAGSNFVYWFHRNVLHRRTRARFAYERHTLQHHRFFDYDHITPDEPGDIYVVLFPWWSGGLLAALSLGVALALTPLAGSNAAHLVMLMMVTYLLLYEITHTVCHLPDSNPLTRMPVLAFLREHHRIHHDPRLMAKHNFNIVIPLFDWWRGALLTSRDRDRP